MNARIFSLAAFLFAVLTAAAVFLPPQVSAQSAPMLLFLGLYRLAVMIDCKNEDKTL